MIQKFEDIIAWQKAVLHSVRNASLGRKMHNPSACIPSGMHPARRGRIPTEGNCRGRIYFLPSDIPYGNEIKVNNFPKFNKKE